MSTTRYSIIIRGEVDATTLERLGGPDARVSGGQTDLVCEVIDQSQLVGVLSGLSGVGLEVISAMPLDS